MLEMMEALVNEEKEEEERAEAGGEDIGAGYLD